MFSDSTEGVLMSQVFFQAGFAVLALDQEVSNFRPRMSIGGAIATTVSLSQPNIIRGTIFIAPGLCPNPNLEPGLRNIAKCLSLGCGCLPLKKMGPDHISRNLENNNYWDDNPNTFKGRMAVSSAVAMLDWLEELQKKCYELSVSVFVIQGR
jgi:hypothetical protein